MRFVLPSLFLALALAVSGTQFGQVQAGVDTEQRVVQQAPLPDTLIPPGDAKPCFGKPGGFVSLKFIEASVAGSVASQESSSAAYPIKACAVGLSSPGQGRGRAPPVSAFA